MFYTVLHPATSQQPQAAGAYRRTTQSQTDAATALFPAMLSPTDKVQLSDKPKVRFGGEKATRQLQEGRIYRESASPWGTKAVQKFVREDDTPYVGNIPNPLLEKSKLSQADFFQQLDELAARLEKASPWLETLMKPIPTHHQFGELTLKVQKMGAGYFNKAYKISDGDHSYVLKVHKDKERNPIRRFRLDEEDFKDSEHSSHHDAGIGLFLTHHQIYKNVARTYAANPAHPSAGWTLQEFISPSTKTAERDGLALYTDVPALVEDDCSDNRVGYKSAAEKEAGTLCDLGGIWSLSIRLKPKQAK